MALKTFRAVVRLSNGSSQEIHIQADNAPNAKAMIETLYGNGTILFGPS